MSQPSPLNEQEQAELVAYLDGELAGEAARKLETRLSQDPTVRAEADALKRTWDLLDFLPKPEPSPSFTHRTLERVGPVRRTGALTAATTGAAPTGGSTWWTLALGAGWLACLLLAGGAGFCAYEALVPAPPPPQPEPVSPAPGRELGKPAYLSDFSPEVQTFVNDTLMPMLGHKEKEYLRDAEGKWPQYAHALLSAAGRHEVLPPVYNTAGVTTYANLPTEWKQALPRPRLVKEGHWDALKQAEGRWPRFALFVTNLAAHEKPKSRTANLSPLGACKPKDFSPDVQLFLERKLLPALTDAERKRLTETEGKWPEYPRLLVSLAGNHQLVIPGMMLPDF